MDKVLLNVNQNQANQRMEYISNQADVISNGIRDCINNSPFKGKSHYIYIFAHKRSGDFVGDPDRMIWQSRLTKPRAQTNSMLFKVYESDWDAIEIKWIIPPREQWAAYQKGTLFENEMIAESIHDFQHNRGFLEKEDDGDLSEERVQEIYAFISRRRRSNS